MVSFTLQLTKNEKRLQEMSLSSHSYFAQINQDCQQRDILFFVFFHNYLAIEYCAMISTFMSFGIYVRNKDKQIQFKIRRFYFYSFCLCLTIHLFGSKSWNNSQR